MKRTKQQAIRKQKSRIRHRSQKSFIGKGLINSLINKTPIELHVPTYRYLGPGTKLNEKLASNIPGINPLDEAAKQHDIAYSRFKDLPNRHKADKKLELKAWERVKAKDASLSEKGVAWLTTTAMKLKRKLEGGSVRTTRRQQKRKSIRKKKRKTSSTLSFNQFVSKARRAIKNRKNSRNDDLSSLVKHSLAAIKKYKVKNQPIKPRILPLPQVGGFIPLIPILTALSHVGSLASGVSSIVNAIKNIKSVRDQYKAQKGSGISFDSLNCKVGSNLRVLPYKKGLGLQIFSS